MRQAYAVVFAVLAATMAPARAQSEVDQLRHELQQRDATIQDLLRRVEALERQSRAPVAAPRQVAQPPSPPAASAAPSAPAADDEEDAVRALEQALVRQGGLVLPPRAVEVEAGYLYTFDGNRALGIVPTAAGALVAPATSRTDRHEASIGLRVGLPHAWQLTLRLPYAYVRQASTSASVGFDSSAHTSGLGDAEIQLSRQFADDGHGHPALLASIGWKSASGDYRAGQPSPGTGFDSIQVGLTAVKRQDPLVFFGGLSYTAVRAASEGGNRTRPGATTDLRLGTLLAASPQSSLRIGLDLARTLRTRVNGAGVPGTDTLSGVIELGLVTLFNRTTSLDVSVGFGVTPDAPRLRLGVAVPIRFR